MENGQIPDLRLARIQTRGLFRLYNHDVPLNLDERVTILHGPNGVGKTMLLTMVEALLTGEYGIFFEVPFESLILTFTDRSTLDIARSDDEGLPRLTVRSSLQPENYSINLLELVRPAAVMVPGLRAIRRNFSKSPGRARENTKSPSPACARH